MAAQHEITKEANEITRNLQKKAERLHEDYLAAESHAAYLKAERDKAALAPKRRANFQIKIGADYQCPQCWIADERRSVLTPIPSDTPDDIFRCSVCHLVIIDPH